MMTSVEVVRRPAAAEAAANIAVAIMNFHGTFASRDAIGITAAESECIAGEKRRCGDADHSDDVFLHDFVPIVAVNRSLTS